MSAIRMSEYTGNPSGLEVINMEENRAPSPRLRQPNPPPAEFDDLNESPGTCSWNPIDWYKEIVGELSSFDWKITEKRRVLLRAVFGEGLVTFLFLFIAMAVAVNNGRQQNPENLVLGALCTALSAVALIYSFADVSGAHFNPAVTFATMVTGKVSLRKGLAFIGIQLVASVFSTLWLYAVFPVTEAGIASQVLVQPNPNTPTVNAFFMEFSLSFILIYVIFATAFDTVDTKKEDIKVDINATEAEKKAAKSENEIGRYLTIYTASGNSKAGFAPLSIGFTLGFLCLLGGSVSGGAFNPARAFGPALVTGSFQNHWIYWVADLLGAALAGWTQHLFSHEAVQSSGTVRSKQAAQDRKLLN